MIEWIKQERGWYTSAIGGISLEKKGWWFWPLDGHAPYGPFKSLVKAQKRAAALSGEGKP